MSLKKEKQQIFKEIYLEHLYLFLRADEKYLLMREEISLVENEVLEFPTKNNKENLRLLKLQIVEYLHINIYIMGFSEGTNCSQSKAKYYFN